MKRATATTIMSAAVLAAVPLTPATASAQVPHDLGRGRVTEVFAGGGGGAGASAWAGTGRLRKVGQGRFEWIKGSNCDIYGTGDCPSDVAFDFWPDTGGLFFGGTGRPGFTADLGTAIHVEGVEGAAATPGLSFDLTFQRRMVGRRTVFEFDGVVLRPTR